MTLLDIVVLGVAIAVVAFIFAFHGKTKRESFATGPGALVGNNLAVGSPVKDVADAGSCARTCKATPGCAYYTWLGPGSKFPNTCWLKTETGGGKMEPWPDSFTGKPGDQITPPKPITTGNNPMLEYHNMVRAKHGANTLEWDDGIAQHAQTWANRCTLQHGSSDTVAHGQNLAWGHSDQIAAAADWYDEYKDIQALNDITKGGHFTQMVWKNTKKMGCGVAQCSIPGWGGAMGPYYVCEYDPPGNIAFFQMEREHYPLQVQVNPSY